MPKATPSLKLSSQDFERFWKSVNTDGPVPPYAPELGSCWLWTGTRSHFGHGVFRYQQRPRHQKKLMAHRVVWDLANGVIPAGLCVLHRCDVPACVRPDHLFLGTRIDNVRDMDQKGRRKILYGEQVGRAKLTEEDVVDILLAIASGESKYSLAKRYHVRKGTIGHIAQHRTWKHVSGEGTK